MIQIILNEWKILLRVRMLAVLTLLFAVGLVVVTWLGVIQNGNQREQQHAAQRHVRAQWENIDGMNPHGAVHFGSYAFKPVTPLSSIDEGVNAVTGNVLRLEGHVQNEIVYSEASQSLSISEFGKLKPSLLLQFVIPLLLIFLAFASVSSEKEAGRLKLLVFQGVSLPTLILAKSISVWLYGLLLLTLTVGVQSVINLNSMSADIMLRTLLLLFAYAAYYYIVVTLAVFLSARLTNNTAALSSMLAVWMLWTIFLPRIWGNTTTQLHPLPSRQEFKTALREDRSKGIDGHNPSDKREEELKQKVLAEYQVERIEQLPINFDGIVMQADEEYGNQVWDKHFGRNHEILRKQKHMYQLSGFLNPFAALQGASMGLSGSDMLHHLDFLRQAEHYRRGFVKALNDKLAYGGSKTGDWNWEADKAFYESVADFSYEKPHFARMFSNYLVDVLSLAFWVALATLLATLAARNVRLV